MALDEWRFNYFDWKDIHPHSCPWMKLGNGVRGRKPSSSSAGSSGCYFLTMCPPAPFVAAPWGAPVSDLVIFLFLEKMCCLKSVLCQEDNAREFILKRKTNIIELAFCSVVELYGIKWLCSYGGVRVHYSFLLADIADHLVFGLGLYFILYVFWYSFHNTTLHLVTDIYYLWPH